MNILFNGSRNDLYPSIIIGDGTRDTGLEMTTLKDSFVDLERHRLRLEENVLKLRQSLQHWQTWEAEYEGLKEEILALGDKPSSTDLVGIGREFGGTLVNEKEVKTLVGDGNSIQRTGKQVVDLVSRRIDYVQQNIGTVEKQIVAAEEKLTALLVIRQPEVRNKEGLPLTEIREELDEEGNVISSTTTIPGDAAPQVVEALRKAGVTDMPSLSNVENEVEELAEPADIPSATSAGAPDPEQVLEETADTTGTDDLGSSEKSLARNSGKSTVDGPDGETLKSMKKRVTFANAVPVDDSNASTIGRVPATYGHASPTSKSIGVIIGGMLRPSEAKDQTTADDSPPVVPIDESPEDAAMRRQMLQYGLNEVEAVVAELDLDDGSESQFSYSDDDLDSEEQYASSVEDDEDAFGRTTRRVVDNDYRKEMLELEKKLNAQVIENVRPDQERYPLESKAMAVKQTSNITSNNISTSAFADKPQKSAVKKGVRFAEELDISPAPGESSTTRSASVAISEAIPIIQDSIVERASPQMRPSATASFMPKKASQFKSARKAAATLQQHDNAPMKLTGDPQLANGPLNGPILERKVPKAASSLPLFSATSTKRKPFTESIHFAEEEPTLQVPEGPPGKTHTNSIIEREPPQSAADVPDPEDIDPALLQQEVAIEYHRMRNRMIQREGGFLPREDQEERVPLTQEEGGSAKKLSRFKAARLGRQAQV